MIWSILNPSFFYRTIKQVVTKNALRFSCESVSQFCYKHQIHREHIPTTINISGVSLMSYLVIISLLLLYWSPIVPFLQHLCLEGRMGIEGNRQVLVQRCCWGENRVSSYFPTPISPSNDHFIALSLCIDVSHGSAIRSTTTLPTRTTQQYADHITVGKWNH